ncbi:MAG: zf-HC2 domain-containing protein [Fidelibacterota bacterium]|nr:MAG: zf-HC2 domain-containing protein [Candidatus Neomarinimicrobiota bacterium]
MNCSQYRFKISPYLDQELTFTELKMFREHLEGCPNCAELTLQMERTQVAMRDELQASLAPDFVPRLEARIRAEINRTPSWWRQMTAPRLVGFSPISLSGAAAAALAIVVIGVSLFLPDSAPLVDPPTSSTQNNPPVMMTRNSNPASQAANPLLTTTPQDSTPGQRDSVRRDFSRQMKYVNQGRRP